MEDLLKNLTESQIRYLCGIINSYGCGQHPWIDEITVKYCTVEYVQEILNENHTKIDKRSSEEGIKALEKIMWAFDVDY